MIYQNSSLLFSRICDSPPSLEEKNIILSVLEKCRFSNIKYDIDVIQGDKHKKLTGIFYSSDKFIEYLESLCKDGIKYGVELHLN